MSQVIPAANCTTCEDAVVTSYPGVAGAAGAAGASGENGVSPFTVTTAGFTVPAVNGNVTIDVGNSSWMIAGSTIYVQNAGWYQVVSKPTGTSATIKNLGYTGNAAPTTVIAVTQQVGNAGAKGADGASPSVVLDDISPTTTLGDILADNGANAPLSSLVRFPVGADDTVLVADSTQATGLLYKVPKLTATASLDFAVFAGLDVQDLTIALAGALVGDPVELGCPAAIPSGLVPFAFVSAAGTVTVRMTAIIAVADPAAMDYTVRINKL